MNFSENRNSLHLFRQIDSVICTGNTSTSYLAFQKSYYIIGDSGCNGTGNKWYTLVNKGEVVYAQKYWFTETKKIDSALVDIKKTAFGDRILETKKAIVAAEKAEEIERENKERAELLAKKEEEEIELRKLDSVKQELDKIYAKYRPANVVIMNWDWSYPNQFSSFIQIDITFTNHFKKKIKYLWFTFSFLNPVGDPARDGLTGSSQTVLKGIGPIDYMNSGSYSFESAFYSKVVDKVKLTQVKLQFFDGTIKTLNKPGVIEFPPSD